MDRVSQGPVVAQPKPPLTLTRLARLNRHGEVTKALRMLVANGELADYDGELANRIHDAIEIVEGMCQLDRYWEGRWRDEKAETERLRVLIRKAHKDGFNVYFGPANPREFAEGTKDEQNAWNEWCVKHGILAEG